MKINIDELLANMPKDEDELKTVQEKHRKILTDNREKEKQRKKHVIYTEVMLPPNAPQEYADRSLLWNSVEWNETKANAQLARSIELALPAELNHEQNISLVRKLVQKLFVDKGMHSDIVCQDALDHDLCPTVGAGRLDRGHIFLVGMRVVRAVDSGRRREHKVLAATGFHRFKQHQRAVNVVPVILKRLLNAFADCLESCEMDHCINFVKTEHIDEFAAAAVKLIELRSHTRDDLDAINN